VRLLVDVGNTCIKWRLDREAQKAYDRGVSCGGLDALAESLECVSGLDSIVVGSVSSSEFNYSLKCWLIARFGVEPNFVVSTQRAGALLNAYDVPQALGVDRWAAIVAAYYQFSRSVLVVDCGSAITIDFVGEDGGHKGGYIMPGLGVMYRALVGDTQKIIGLSEEFPEDLMLANTTHGAVNKGTALFAVSAIERVKSEIESKIGLELLVVLTGGDALKIAKLLSFRCEFEKDLVLDGIDMLAVKGVE